MTSVVCVFIFLVMHMNIVLQKRKLLHCTTAKISARKPMKLPWKSLYFGIEFVIYSQGFG